MRLKTLILFLLVALLAGCLRSIPNNPDLLAQFQLRKENLLLEFQTDKGRQVAYYLPPLKFPGEPPQKLAILYPGIDSIALDWLKYIKLSEYPTNGYLLIDYPGRGLSEGIMRPEENYRNSLGALKALAAHFGKTQLASSLSLLGHSFGTGAALQFAVRQPVKRIVLVAPFNTLKQGVMQKSWLLGLLMPSQIDNRVLIKTLLEEKKPPQIAILHGKQDKSLPFFMGLELAAIAPDKIRFYPFPEDGHVNILNRRRELIFSLLNNKITNPTPLYK